MTCDYYDKTFRPGAGGLAHCERACLACLGPPWLVGCKNDRRGKTIIFFIYSQQRLNILSKLFLNCVLQSLSYMEGNLELVLIGLDKQFSILF